MSSKLKSKVSKLMEKIDSQNDEAEHELAFYINDRVQLMKEILKIIKAKKIKSMAPDCIKNLDIEEINSMLLEELLGISNKRLKYIFNGQNLGEDSSSTDSEDEKQPIDIISLDDVSDDDFVIDGNTENSKKKTYGEPKVKKIKKEKVDKKNKQKDGSLEEENLMSVLELLELQARARAIKSQLLLETNKKIGQPTQVKSLLNVDSDSDNSVIIEVPKSEEIIIDSSESECEEQTQKCVIIPKNSNRIKEIVSSSKEAFKKKITLIRDRFDKQRGCELTSTKESCNNDISGETNEMEDSNNTTEKESEKLITVMEDGTEKLTESNSNTSQPLECISYEDEIVLIVDQEEMDGIIGN